MKATVGELQRTKPGEETRHRNHWEKKKQRHPDGALVNCCGLSEDTNALTSSFLSVCLSIASHDNHIFYGNEKKCWFFLLYLCELYLPTLQNISPKFLFQLCSRAVIIIWIEMVMLLGCMFNRWSNLICCTFRIKKGQFSRGSTEQVKRSPVTSPFKTQFHNFSWTRITFGECGRFSWQPNNWRQRQQPLTSGQKYLLWYLTDSGLDIGGNIISRLSGKFPSRFPPVDVKNDQHKTGINVLWKCSSVVLCLCYSSAVSV